MHDGLRVPRIDGPFERGERLGRQRFEPCGVETGRRLGVGSADHETLQLRALDLAEPGHQIAMHDHEFGIGVRHHMFENRTAIGGVDGHEDGAEIIDREVAEQRLRAVRQPCGDVVALFHAERLQCRRARGGALQRLAIAPAFSVAENDIGLVRLFARETFERIAQHACLARGNARIGKRGGGFILHDGSPPRKPCERLAIFPAIPSSSPCEVSARSPRWAADVRPAHTSSPSTTSDR